MLNCFFVLRVGTVISHPTWSTHADCRLTIPGRKVTHLYESAKAPSYVDSDYIRKFEVATGTPYPVGENKTGAYNIYIYIQISISYRRTPKYHLVVDLIVMFDYIKKKSYYSYIVSIYHQFIFEILWDYTCLLSCNQLSAQFSACVTKDQGPRSQRRNFQNRRFEKKGRFSKGRGPRRDAANQSRNAGTKGRFQKACEIPMCLKVETFKLNSQGVPRTLYRWRFQLF